MTVILLTHMAGTAEDLRLEATLERNSVSPGNPLYLYITFYGDRGASRPEVPTVDGLQIKYIGPAAKMTVINGKISQSTTHTYLVIPKKDGKFTIGPFFVDYDGQTYKSGAVELDVNASPAPVRGIGPSAPLTGGRSAYPAPAAAEPSQSIPYVSDNLFLTVDIEKRRVYVNEVVSVVIKVFVNNMGLKDIEYPRYPHEGFSVGEFEEPQRQRENYRGTRYDTLVFRQSLFGIKEGSYVLGPATLNCKMVIRQESSRRSSLFGRSIFDDDFFSSHLGGYRTQSIEIASEEIPVTILPFPEEGRPENFQGAVGYFDLDVNVDYKKVKVGDPIVLRMVISGRGNLDTVTAPKIAETDKFKIYEPQVTKKAGRKIYEQVLIPKSEEAKEVPEVSFSFFNPESEKYKVIKKGPFPVEVALQPESERVIKMVSTPGVEDMFYPQEKLGEDIIYIKEDIGSLRPKGEFLYKRGAFWALQLMPLALFAVFYAAYRKKERILKDKSYARFLKAPRKARKGLARARTYLARKDILPFYDTVFKTLQEYLGNRFNLPRGGVTEQIICDRLRPAGCDEKILKMLHDVLSECEMARYASFVPEKYEAEEVMEMVKKIIDYMEKIRL